MDAPRCSRDNLVSPRGWQVIDHENRHPLGGIGAAPNCGPAIARLDRETHHV